MSEIHFLEIMNKLQKSKFDLAKARQRALQNGHIAQSLRAKNMKLYKDLNHPDIKSAKLDALETTIDTLYDVKR